MARRDAAKLIADARARAHGSKAHRAKRSADELLASARNLGSMRKADAKAVEKKLAAAKSLLRSARARD